MKSTNTLKLLCIILLLNCGSAYCAFNFRVPHNLEKLLKELPEYRLLTYYYNEEINDLLSWAGKEKDIKDLGFFCYEVLEDAFSNGVDTCCWRRYSEEDGKKLHAMSRNIVFIAGIVMGENFKPSKYKQLSELHRRVSSCFDNPSQTLLKLENVIGKLKGSFFMPTYCPRSVRLINNQVEFEDMLDSNFKID